MNRQLLETWDIHNRIHFYLLDAIPPEALSGVPVSKGRSVGEVFAHIHNARLMWLEVSAADLSGGLVKIAKEQANDHALLRRSLEESGQAMHALLARGLETGKIKGFKPHPPAFLGYAIAHEAHHRGEIGVILKQSGHPLDRKVDYGMWEWGVR